MEERFLKLFSRSQEWGQQKKKKATMNVAFGDSLGTLFSECPYSFCDGFVTLFKGVSQFNL
jgi:hypothetical protein